MWSGKTKSEVDFGTGHQLLIEKFRIKLTKVGKNTGPFRHGLCQISCDYKVEVITRFKVLDQVDRMPEELWMDVHNTIQDVVTKTSPKKKKCRRKNGSLRRLYNSWGKKRRKARWKGKIYPTEFRVPENTRKDKKTFLNEQCKEVEENNTMRKTKFWSPTPETRDSTWKDGWCQ